MLNDFSLTALVAGITKFTLLQKSVNFASVLRESKNLSHFRNVLSLGSTDVCALESAAQIVTMAENKISLKGLNEKYKNILSQDQ